MKSKKPYLLEAMYNWINDSGMTPHVLVDASKDDVVVPNEYIIKNKIVLNIDEDSIDDFSLNEESLSFNAYFGTNSDKMLVFVPMNAVISIFAQENAEGLTFEDESESLAKKISSVAKNKILQKIAVKKSQKATVDSNKKAKPTLTIVKD
jgi:stringent starvation protein B